MQAVKSPSKEGCKHLVTNAREERGLSAEELAVLAGTSAGTIERVEAGAEIDPVLRSTLAAALNIAPSKLSDEISD